MRQPSKTINRCVSEITLKSANVEELRGFLGTYPDVKTVELLVPDINGILRGKRIGRDELETLYTQGLRMCTSTLLLDSRGDIDFDIGIGARDGGPDVMCRPAAGALAPVTWLGDSAIGQVLVSLQDTKGAPWYADPRHVLARVHERLRESGLRAVVATEFEFYLLAPGNGAAPQPWLGSISGTGLKQRGPQFATVEDLWECDAFFRDVQRCCEEQNVPANTALPEFSPGQFEVNLHHEDDPVLACDHGALLKRIIKGTAFRHGLGATFMAKPFAEHSGSGLHIHVSLLDKQENNVFVGPGGRGGPVVSATLRHAIGGLQQTMAEAMAVFAPNANSYRRLQPASFAPLSPNWGYNHRAVALRLPLATGHDMRIEHRPAGADANPYLAAAAVLAGIHHGITRKCEPTEMIEEGTMMDEREAGLPRRWDAALDLFRDSGVLPEYLGEEFCRVYEIVRRNECERFHRQVGNLDYEWYLRGV